MKILYIANERRTAEQAAVALRAAAPGLVIAWAATLAAARGWLTGNPNIALLIIEVPSDDPGYAAFVTHVRRSGITAPLIVVSLGDPASLTSLKDVAAAIVMKDHSLPGLLPSLVSRALKNVPQTTPRAVRVGYVGEATLARECFAEPGGAIELVETAPGPDGAFDPLPADVRPGEPLPFDVLLIEHGVPGVDTLAILKGITARRLQIPVVLVAEWVDDLAVLAHKLGVVDYVVKSKASFRALLFRLHHLLAQPAHQRPAEAAALAGRLADQHAEFTTRLDDAVRARHELHERLISAEAALEVVQRKLADTTTVLDQARLDREASSAQARTQAAADAELAAEIGLRQAVETRLTAAVAALERAEERHASEMREAAARLEDRDKKAAAEVAEAVVASSELQSKLADATAALERAEERHASEMSEAAARLRARDERAAAEVAEAVGATSELQDKLADAAATLERAEEQARAARESASEAAAQSQAAFDAQLAAEVGRREALEGKLADAAAALEHAERRRGSEMHEAKARLVEHQRGTEARLAQAAAAFDAVQARLVEAAAQLQRAEQQAAADRQAAAEEAARRRLKFEGELAEHVSRRQLLEKQLADAELRLTQSAESGRALQETLAEVTSELANVRQRADADRLAAQQQAARQQADFDRQIAQGAADREAIERALADEVAERHRTDEQHASEIDAAARRLAESQRRAEAQMAQAAAEATASLQVAVDQAAAAQRAAAERAAEREGALETEIGQQAARREVLEAELADTRAASEQAERRFLDQVTAMRQSAREHEARLEERAARERAEWEDTLAERQQRMQQLQTEGADLANERGRLEALVARQTIELEELAAGRRAAEESAAQALADVERRLASTLEAQARDRAEIADLQKQVATLEARLDATRGERDRLKAQADRVPRLRQQIDDIRSEHCRRFDEATIGLLRCDRDGGVTGVNRALAALLGYDSPEKLQSIDFAAAVFESGSELPSIAGRLASSSIEPVETTWKARDGSRLVVRLHAVPATADSIELAVEDITTVHELEEKLRISQRRAAVAQYASEAASACDRLLEDIALDARRWLATIDNDAARRQGQRLLDDVTRAAGRLQQVAICNSEEKKGFELVDVHKLLRHLQPVLRQIAGSRIEIVLPKATAPLNLEVETERVERILINVAAYGRERMPRGGRLTIGVDSVVVDQTFVAQHPQVGTGPHVLLTITEKRGDPRPGLVAMVPGQAADAEAARPASGTPGVDLGALQSLVGDCAGHLWMATEPSGDLVIKIHLPRRALDRAEPHPAATRPILARWVDRLSGARP